jgi:hypothetical protein
VEPPTQRQLDTQSEQVDEQPASQPVRELIEVAYCSALNSCTRPVGDPMLAVRLVSNGSR